MSKNKLSTPDNKMILRESTADFITACLKLTVNQRLTLQQLSAEQYVSRRPAYMFVRESQLAPLDLQGVRNDTIDN